MSGRHDWHRRGLQAIGDLCRRQQFICSDDVWLIVNAPPDDLHNGMGALFNDAREQGLIRQTGRIVQSKRKEAKGRNIQVWESAWYFSGQKSLL